MLRLISSRITYILLMLLVLSLLGPFEPPLVQAAESSACLAQHCTFLPAMIQPASVDLTITAVEVSQAIQTPTNSVPLVAGRKTIVRIYAKAIIAEGTPSTVAKIKLTATRGGVQLSGSIETSASAVPTNPLRGVYSSTVNLYLPEAWASGTIVLTAAVDSGGQVAESNETNNAITQPLTFNSVPNLKVMIVPVRYTHLPNGITYPAPSADTIKTKIKYMYPTADVDISWHAPYDFTGNLTLGSEFSKLLNTIGSMKNTEGQPSTTAYFALVPADWFGGGIVGIGYVGYRAAVGLNYWDATGTAAHEIGHNMGLRHAPCGNPSGVDTGYPYPGALIGQYGVNVYTNVFIPNTQVDLMSYCNNEWISDYHYIKLYNDQVAYFDTATPEVQSSIPTLLLRAVVDAQGGAVFSPSYALAGQADTPAPDSLYHVRLLDEAGKLLSEQAVRVYEVADLPEPEYHLMSRVALPEGTVARVQLWRADALLAEQVLADRINPQARLSAAVQDGQLTWSGRTTGPVLVRYSLDAGLTWQTLAVDVAGGSLMLDPALQSAQFKIIPALSW